MSSVKRRQFLGIAGGSVTALGMLGLRPANAAGPTFRVGIASPLTGSGAPYGVGMVACFKIAADEINAAGGILGRKVELFIEDAQTDPSAATLAVRKLIDINKVDAVLGTWSSAVTLAILPLTNNANLLEMNTSGAPGVQTLNTKGLVWTINATSNTSGVAAAQVVAKMNFKRVAAVAVNVGSSRDNVNAFVDAWKAAGHSIIAQTVYEPNQPSYRSVLEKILRDKPDLIFSSPYLSDAIVLIRDWYQLGGKNQWMMPKFAVNSELVKAVGVKPTNGIMAYEGVADAEAAAFKALAPKYNAATHANIEDNPYAPEAYDMLITTALAATKAGAGATSAAISGQIREVANPPGEKVSSYAQGIELLGKGQKINYEGASSVLDFTKSGIAVPTIGFWRMEDGQLKLFETIKPKL